MNMTDKTKQGKINIPILIFCSYRYIILLCIITGIISILKILLLSHHQIHCNHGKNTV